MSLCLELGEVRAEHAESIGGKAFALARLHQHGFAVPPALCITSRAYRRFVDETEVAEGIRLELFRKSFQDMRWEELWDASLRIRRLFAATPLPPQLEQTLADRLEAFFAGNPVAVRSSAFGEDSGKTSFAGLHESVLNVSGPEQILQQLKRVWASLWSDAALLYRQELSLEVESSSMAVLVQRFVPGRCSGVVFSQSPLDPEVAVVEAVPGLAKGLVDGEVEPERWTIDRASGRSLSWAPPREYRRVVPDITGVRLVDEPPRKEALLNERELAEVYTTAREAETLFGAAQDVEWTLTGEGLRILQSRPVTAKKEAPGDARTWNLSLRRSYENLVQLRRRIEDSILPGMIAEADSLAAVVLRGLSDPALAAEIDRRLEILERWRRVYWDELIPFAHGMRLFGQVYNDTLRPQDPFSFVELLRPLRMESLDRNRLLLDLARRLESESALRQALEVGGLGAVRDQHFVSLLESYRSRYANLLGLQADRERMDRHLASLLLEMSAAGAPLNQERKDVDREALEQEFLACFQGEERQRAAELLDLGRASYRIRDDDNIYFDRFKGLLGEAVEAGRQRLAGAGVELFPALEAADVARVLLDRSYRPTGGTKPPAELERSAVDARQLLGQPASHGIASGYARVILQPQELFSLKKGEILVCDAIDPAMTFAAPLAAAIVERRGGMLIHGAIIAREYGIPCVTGILEATRRIRTGDRLTVDGYLGIVVIADRRPV